MKKSYTFPMSVKLSGFERYMDMEKPDQDD